MEPRFCSGTGEKSDCMRACIASILDRDDVPDTFAGVRQEGEAVEQAWTEMRKWLAAIGYSAMIIPFEQDPREQMEELNPVGHYMLLCSNNDNHAVVCQGGKIVHDPAFYRTPITGPLKNGYYIVVIIGKL